MRATYEFELYRGERQWVAEAYNHPGCVTQGEDVADACESAADILREYVHEALMGGGQMPPSTFGHEPRRGGVNVIVSVDTTLDAVEKISASQAARMLGVSRGRVTAMMASGLLDGWRDGRNTWVSLASVEARLDDPRKAGRPRKEPATA